MVELDVKLFQNYLNYLRNSNLVTIYGIADKSYALFIKGSDIEALFTSKTPFILAVTAAIHQEKYLHAFDKFTKLLEGDGKKKLEELIKYRLNAVLYDLF